MGLFSKETCCFCGKEVGMMSRTKLADGNYICNDCRYLTHPFIRIDRLDREQVTALMQEMEASEAHFQQVKWRETTRRHGADTWTFYDNIETGEFALYSPETKRYKNHFVYDMALVRPYNRSEAALGTRLTPLTVNEIKSSITLTQKESGGNPDGWVLHIPYFPEHVNIDIKFPAGMKESDVRYVYQSIRDIIGNVNPASRERLDRNREMQNINLTHTANKVLGAMLKGQGTEGVVQAVEQGIKTSNDIDEGKVRKGLFGRLKKS